MYFNKEQQRQQTNKEKEFKSERHIMNFARCAAKNDSPIKTLFKLFHDLHILMHRSEFSDPLWISNFYNLLEFFGEPPVTVKVIHVSKLAYSIKNHYKITVSNQRIE